MKEKEKEKGHEMCWKYYFNESEKNFNQKEKEKKVFLVTKDQLFQTHLRTQINTCKR